MTVETPENTWRDNSVNTFRLHDKGDSFNAAFGRRWVIRPGNRRLGAVRMILDGQAEVTGSRFVRGLDDALARLEQFDDGKSQIGKAERRYFARPGTLRAISNPAAPEA
ncbi:MAG: hypothetical protein WAM73_01290 [Desulfobacterales bacterium]